MASGRLRFTDRLVSPGAFRYEARLLAGGRCHSRATTARRSGSRCRAVRGVLLVTAYENDPLGEALGAQGFEVEVVTDLSAVNVGTLSGAKVVLLNNVPVYKLDSEFVRAWTSL